MVAYYTHNETAVVALDLFNEMIDGELSQIQLLWWLVHYKHVQLLVVQKSVRRSMNMLLGKVLS